MRVTQIDVKTLLDEEAKVAPRRSLSAEAADALRELILLEKLAPGTPVPERDLAAGLGISRTPLKEAMRMLEDEGLIQYSPSRRPSVADPTLEQISDNLTVLAALESLGGGLACLRATDEEIESAGGLCDRMREHSETAPPLEFFRWDMDFHAGIVAAARNAPLIETHRQYNARSWRARFISSRMRTGRRKTLDQHENIAAAFRARDVRATRRAMRIHLETAVTNIARAQSESTAPRDSS